MRLKTLELQGYKTFAHKTRFEFPLPITAIVGPNGSGKSNIADAIRWVLGEQSYSLLRGRKTMDMIFTGSDQKARAGMASVSILFDNDEEWLPIDYDEVSITRRAYRSGENDYLLNGQRIRLKDINELLGQSGLAERTYTIIGQGLIDTALSLKPDDRRRFFEEAAGIGLFRSRREEALTRLEATRRNLERISDILGELEPRMNSLARQAKRASEYEQLKNDLTALLREWYGFHWHQSQGALIDAMAVSEAQEARTVQLRAEFIAMEKNLGAEQELYREKRYLLGTLHNQLSQLHQVLDDTNRQTAILDERVNAGRKQISAYKDEAETVQAEIVLLMERIGKQEVELTSQRDSIDSALSQKDEFERALKEKQKELFEIQNQRSAQRNQLTEKETAIIKIRARHDEMKSQKETLETAVGAFRQSLQTLEAERSSFRTSLVVAETDFKQIENALAEMDLAQVSLREQQNELEKQRVLEQTAYQTLQADFSRKKARLDVLEQAERNLIGLSQGAQTLLKKGHFSSAIRSLTSYFLFPEMLEVAAAAVLGEAMDAVALDRSVWGSAIELLRTADQGRAMMVSTQFDSAHPEKKQNHFHGLRPLSVLAESTEETLPLTDRLFGDAYVVDSIGDAMKWQHELRGNECLVTRTGEVFRADGSVTAGTEQKHQLLSRKREIQTLQREIELQQKELDALREKLAVAEEAIQQVQKQSELKQQQRQAQNQAFELTRHRMNQVSLDLQKREQQILFQQQRIQENERKADELQTKITADLGRIEANESELSALRENVRQLSDAMRQIQLDELQRQAHHWSLEWNLAVKTVKETELRIADLNGQLMRSQQRLAQNEAKRVAVENQLGALSLEQTGLQSGSSVTAEQIDEAEAKLSPLEAELKSHEIALDALQTETVSFQVKVSAAEKQLVQTQMDVARLNDQLETLKTRIEDDFGLVAFEFREKVAGQTPLPLGDMVADLPRVEMVPENMKDQISRQKGLIHRMGAINPDAVEEYKSVSERFVFLKTQSDDLKKADKDLREVIAELDEMMKNTFQRTFDQVQVEFKEMFSRLFGGGAAKLILTDPENVHQSGIDIEAKLPGRREQELSLLSGGERALTSVALVFSLLRVSPTPFCVLDEVDAALDEANVGRFCDLLKELSRETQFILITHNRNTVETADVIYGITMGRDSASQVVSLRLDQVGKDLAY